jgi:hypothetical protein
MMQSVTQYGMSRLAFCVGPSHAPCSSFHFCGHGLRGRNLCSCIRSQLRFSQMHEYMSQRIQIGLHRHVRQDHFALQTTDTQGGAPDDRETATGPSDLAWLYRV